MYSAESSQTFQPYAFLLHGGRRTSQGPSSTGSTPEYLPADLSSGTLTPPSFEGLAGALASTEHGKFLADRLDYVVPPTIQPVERDAPAGARSLFLGHMRFETTTGEVRWLIKRLCGVVPIKAEIRGSGCCVVHLATEADELAVRSLNRRVLFDHNGVWFARTADEVDILIDYVEKVLPRLNGRRRSLRLPRDCLVVEDPRSKKMNHRRPTTGVQQIPSPKDQRHFASSPPSPYSLGSPALGGFHVAPPEYVLGDSVYPSQSATAHPPPYGWDSHHLHHLQS